ncbi:MAG: flippase-like domain-containing protein [Planctomycetes bacterium]|nr:flippase-like domain-containing protein [Planctomycetota bacterium]
MNRPRLRRLVFLTLKCAIVAALVWGVWKTLVVAWAELERHAWSPAELRPGWLAASAALYIAALACWGTFWWRALGQLNQPVGWLRTLRAYCIGHLGKYVPGKALVVVLRAGLVSGPGVNTPVAAASVFLETLTMMAVGAFCAGALLAVSFRDQPWLMLLALGCAVGAGVGTLPAVFRAVVSRVARGKVDAASLDRLVAAPWSWLLTGWGVEAAGWALHGASLWAAAIATGLLAPSFDLQGLIFCTAAGALSIVVGFVALVPGGAVVRETVLLALLPPLFAADGESAALVTALVSRVVALVAELLVSIILYPAARRG